MITPYPPYILFPLAFLDSLQLNSSFFDLMRLIAASQVDYGFEEFQNFPCVSKICLVQHFLKLSNVSRVFGA